MYHLVSPGPRGRALLPKLEARFVTYPASLVDDANFVKINVQNGTHELIPVDPVLNKLISAAEVSQGESGVGVNPHENKELLDSLCEYFNQFYAIDAIYFKHYVDKNNIVRLIAAVGLTMPRDDKPFISIAIKETEGEDKGAITSELVRKPI